MSQLGRAYRYVRIVSLGSLGFGIDALEATTFIGSSDTLDSDGDGITDRDETELGSDPLNPLEPPDTISPEIELISPSNGATVSGIVEVMANAIDNRGIAFVELYVDGEPYGSPDTTSPYSISWDTTGYDNDDHVLSIIAEDTSGNQISSDAEVTVSN
jgi:hypothetical protein